MEMEGGLKKDKVFLCLPEFSADPRRCFVVTFIYDYVEVQDQDHNAMRLSFKL
jgi:hypothetical protein